jgi:hypothetical protein
MEKRGAEVEVGDDLWFLDKPYRITRIEDYVHPVVTRGETWRIAYSDGPVFGARWAWGITLEPDGRYETGQKVGA